MDENKLHYGLAVRVGIALTLMFMITGWLNLPAAQRIPLLGAAFATSTGAQWELAGRRWPIVGVDLLGKSVGLLVGYFTARLPLSGDLTMILPAMILWAAVAGSLTLRHKGLWWVSVQSFAFLGIGAMLSQMIEHPFQVAGLALIGAATMALWLDLPRILRGKAPPERISTLIERGQVFGKAGNGDLLRLALTAGIAVGLSYVMAVWMGMQRAYWAPLTVILVLRPDYTEVMNKLWIRSLMTLIGGAVPTVAVLLLPPAHWSLELLFVLSAMAAAAANGTAFRYFIIFLSSTLVLLVSMGQGGVIENAETRVWATALGGLAAIAVGLIAAAIAPLFHASARPHPPEPEE